MNNLHAHIKFYNKMPKLKRSQTCYLSRQNLRWYIQNNTCNESAKKLPWSKEGRLCQLSLKLLGKGVLCLKEEERETTFIFIWYWI